MDLPLLADAVASDRTWLSDFADDDITITSDLFDVLQAEDAALIDGCSRFGSFLRVALPLTRPGRARRAATTG